MSQVTEETNFMCSSEKILHCRIIHFVFQVFKFHLFEQGRGTFVWLNLEDLSCTIWTSQRWLTCPVLSAFNVKIVWTLSEERCRLSTAKGFVADWTAELQGKVRHCVHFVLQNLWPLISFANSERILRSCTFVL